MIRVFPPFVKLAIVIYLKFCHSTSPFSILSLDNGETVMSTDSSHPRQGEHGESYEPTMYIATWDIFVKVDIGRDIDIV